MLKISIENKKYLGGDVEHTHLVKGLDFALLHKVRSEIDKKPDVGDEADGKLRVSKEDQALTFRTETAKVESAISQVQEVGTGVLEFSKNVNQGFNRLVLPILQKSGDQVVKIAEPAIEVASKKTQEAIEISGIDTEPIHKFVKVLKKRLLFVFTTF